MQLVNLYVVSQCVGTYSKSMEREQQLGEVQSAEFGLGSESGSLTLWVKDPFVKFANAEFFLLFPLLFFHYGYSFWK